MRQQPLALWWLPQRRIDGGGGQGGRKVQVVQDTAQAVAPVLALTGALSAL